MVPGSTSMSVRCGVGTRPGARVRAIVMAALVMMGVSSCETFQFYRQAVGGQVSIARSAEPADELIASDHTDAALKARLEAVADDLRFARERLGLDPGARYTSYVRVAGGYVVWNVFAAPEFSTSPKLWCYPFVGCASYRGYFDRRDARHYAAQLAMEQHDTVVGGVAAYSTLGWFDDPVLSTFVTWPDHDLAGLIFHELAHAKLYIPGDTSFNEAFASFVERQGLVEWLRARGDEATVKQMTMRWRASDRFVAYLLRWRDELQHLYDQPYERTALRLLKAELLQEVERCYRSNQAVFGDQEWFFRKSLNNAGFVPLAAYNERIAGFAGLFEDSGGSWPAFYRDAARLGRLSDQSRDAELDRLGREFEAEQAVVVARVQCDALAF